MINRREVLKTLSAATGVMAAPFVPAWKAPTKTGGFVYCLNMATIRGHKLGFIKELEVASRAGFRSVEIWLESLQTYLKNGGSIIDSKKRLDDLGIKVENAIGFAPWIVDEDTKRNEGIEQMKREMGLLVQIGCKRIAAPPAGATTGAALELKKVAARFNRIHDLGKSTGVMPQLELWGFSKNLSKVSEVMYVAIECGQPETKILLDVFHLYKGGSGIEALNLLNPAVNDIFHINDYSTEMPPATITDADRVYPGDGNAPIKKILQVLGKKDQPLVISLEVFNKNYYMQDPLAVAKTALAKMKSVTNGIQFK